jgi:hypothetical protein
MWPKRIAFPEHLRFYRRVQADGINLEPIWDRPGGLATVPSAEWVSFVGVILPRGVEVWHRDQLHGPATKFYDLLVNARTAEPFELRQRTKEADHAWVYEILMKDFQKRPLGYNGHGKSIRDCAVCHQADIPTGVRRKDQTFSFPLGVTP